MPYVVQCDMSSVWQRAKALLGMSTYEQGSTAAAADDIDLDSPEVEAMRKAYGGQLQPMAHSQARWYVDDVEIAERAADAGSMAQAASLWASARRDAVLSGLLSTRTGGLVRLPKRFAGDPEIVQALELGHFAETGQVRSAFDEMFPQQELALMAADGIGLGVAVGELVPVVGRDFPVLVRLDPRFLMYRWQENAWYFRSILGNIKINPGDGRWVLHTPGGRNAPWQNGYWKSLGLAYIRKSHAALHRDNWEAKLAHPARVAYAPNAATEDDRGRWFRQVAAWGKNSIFQVSPGYEVKLLESNGRGWESFQATIAEQNIEIMIGLAGQTVTTDGGTGFANADIHKSIRADLIKETADALAFTINTQGIPAFVLARFGEDKLDQCPIVLWDVTPPRDLKLEAEALNQVAQAITALTGALAEHAMLLDAPSLCARFGIPIAGDVDGDGKAEDTRVRGILAERQKLRPRLVSDNERAAA